MAKHDIHQYGELYYSNISLALRHSFVASYTLSIDIPTLIINVAHIISKAKVKISNFNSQIV